MSEKVRVATVAFLLAWVANVYKLAAASADAAQLLAQADSQAALLKSDLDTLNFFATSAEGWQTHAGVIAAYRQHIAALRDRAAGLDAARNTASPWQKIAIERIVPLLREFAASAETAIDTIDRNRARLATSDFRQYLKLNADLGDEYRTLVGASVIVANNQEELARVAEKIGSPVPTTLPAARQ